jgi:hypothetical protein
MTDDGRKQSWWLSLPGLLTAVAGLITAIGGLILALNAAGLLSHSQSTDRTPGATTQASGFTGTEFTKSPGPPSVDPTATNVRNTPEVPKDDSVASTGEGSAPSGAPVYAIYTNQKYGYSVPYPRDLLLPWKTTGDMGQSFRSADGKAKMSVLAAANTEHQSIPAALDDMVRVYSTDKANEIVYKVHRPNGFELFVKSGSSRLVRIAVVMTAADYRFLTMEYEQSAKGTFDAVWAHIAREFER